jgi:hypothetical protein
MMVPDVRSFLELRIASLATLALACGDTSEAQEATTPFTIWVFDEGATVTDPDAPLPNIAVAFDPPSAGARVVRTTGADGHVTFDADFARGTARVSAFSAEHTLVTILDTSPEVARARPNTFGKPVEDLAIALPRLDRSIRQASVELRGTLTGKREAAHPVYLAASALRRLGGDDTKTSSYAVRTPRARPFFLLGHELGEGSVGSGTAAIDHIKAFRLDPPPRAEDGALDIDIGSSAPLPVRTVRVRADKPSRDAALFGPGSRAEAAIRSADSQLLVGPLVRMNATPDGRGFDLEMALAETDISPERLITQASMTAPDGSSSRRSELGIIEDGVAWIDFLPAPSVPDASRKLTDAIPLPDFPDGADLRVEVFAAGQLVWILHGHSGGLREKGFILPTLFGLRFSADVQLLAVSLAAEVDRVLLPPHGEFYRRVSTSRDITLRRL